MQGDSLFPQRKKVREKRLLDFETQKDKERKGGEERSRHTCTYIYTHTDAYFELEVIQIWGRREHRHPDSPTHRTGAKPKAQREAENTGRRDKTPTLSNRKPCTHSPP